MLERGKSGFASVEDVKELLMCAGKVRRLGLYTILLLTKFAGIYCNTGCSGGNTVLRNSVGDAGGRWGAQTRGVFANNSISSWTKASN